MTVIDASPLVHLASLGQLRCLEVLPSPLRVPAAVRNEVVAGGTTRRGVTEFLASEAMFVVGANPRSVPQAIAGLGPGETAVLALALERDEVAVIDDLRGRRVAVSLGITVVGTLGVLREAKRKGEVEQLRPLFAQLLEDNSWLSRALVNRVLANVGEQPLEPAAVRDA